MKNKPFISRFSPNRTDPEDLEAITVQREDLIASSVSSVRESTLTENKHHLLFVGPRGAGKTHTIALINHRVSQMADLNDKLRIAWLNEDETSDTLLALLLRIYRALSVKYPAEFPIDLLESVFDIEARDVALMKMKELLLEQISGRVVLIMMENLDALFRDMSIIEQRAWRAFIQDHPVFCMVFTAQRLFNGVSKHDEPFYGFFKITHLKPFNVQDAVDLLCKIAELREDKKFAQFIESPRGRARIRALHHLTGGNQRLFIILSDFINCESLDTLVGPFEELVDEQLTPYYQERLRWLPPLQRKIVEFLCAASKPLPVMNIARHLFTEHASISGQLRDLRNIGYVICNKRGKESLYELSEPLMRLSYQVKECRGSAPLRLLVDFLRVWYDHAELAQRMGSLPMDAVITRNYIDYALTLFRSEGNLCHQFLREDAERIDFSSICEDDINALRELAEEVGEPVDRLKLASALAACGNYRDAIVEYDAVLQNSEITQNVRSNALYNRGVICDKIGDTDAAMSDWTILIKLEGAPVDVVSSALYNRGVTHGDKGNMDNAITDYTAVIELEGASVGVVADALTNRGFVYREHGDMEAAMADYTAVTELEGASADRVADALTNRGFAYSEHGDMEAAMVDYSAVIELEGAPVNQVANAFTSRGFIHWNQGDMDNAIADWSAHIELEGVSVDDVAKALNNRGCAYHRQASIDAAISDWVAVIEMEDAFEEVKSRVCFALSTVTMERSEWSRAFGYLRSAFSFSEYDVSIYRSKTPEYVRAIFDSGQSDKDWKPKLDQFLKINIDNGVLQELATGLTESIAFLESSNISPDGLREWCDLWSGYARDHAELALAARLLSTGVSYFNSGKERSALLDLPEEERRILEQALGLADKAD